MRGTTSMTDSSARIEGGRSHVLSLSERARWIALFRDGVEVGRLPFFPASEGVNTVRW